MQKCGATLTPDLAIKQDNEVDIGVLDTPWQMLKKLTEGVATRARIKEAGRHRQFLKDLEEVDKEAFCGALRGRSKEENDILMYITTGAAWSNEKLHEIGRKDETVCELCGGT